MLWSRDIVAKICLVEDDATAPMCEICQDKSKQHNPAVPLGTTYREHVFVFETDDNLN